MAFGGVRELSGVRSSSLERVFVRNAANVGAVGSDEGELETKGSFVSVVMVCCFGSGTLAAAF